MKSILFFIVPLFGLCAAVQQREGAGLRLTVFPDAGRIKKADSSACWRFHTMGEKAMGTIRYDSNTMMIATKNTRHAFYQSDACSFAWRQQPFPYDDCSQLELSVTIDSLSAGSAGIMMRAQNAPGAANVHLETSASGDIYLFFRKINDDPTSYTHIIALRFPLELKLLRQGDFFTAFYRNTSGEWKKGATVMAVTGAFMCAGLYACSGTVTEEYTQASFRNWSCRYRENYIPPEQHYKDMMPVKPGTLLRDNFNDGSLSDLPESVSNPVWKGISFGELPYRQQGNRYWRKTGDGQFSLGHKKWADYEVSIDIAFDSGSVAASEFSLRLRNQEIPVYANMARYYAVSLRSGNRLVFEKYASGLVFSKNVVLPGFFTGQFQNLKVRLLDAHYEVYFNNKLVFSGTDSPDPVTYGNIVLKCSDVAMKIDNLEVLGINDPVNGDADNFLQDYFDVPMPAYLEKYGWKPDGSK